MILFLARTIDAIFDPGSSYRCIAIYGGDARCGRIIFLYLVNTEAKISFMTPPPPQNNHKERMQVYINSIAPSTY